MPFGAYHVKAVDRPLPYWSELLLKDLFPALFHAELDERLVLVVAERVHLGGHVAVPPSLVVVVAGAEQLLNRFPPGAFAARKHLLPRLGDVLQPAQEPPVREVAADHDGINLAVPEEQERPLQRDRRRECSDVRVGDDAKRQFGLLHLLREDSWRAENGARPCALQETSSADCRHFPFPPHTSRYPTHIHGPDSVYAWRNAERAWSPFADHHDPVPRMTRSEPWLGPTGAMTVEPTAT